MPNGTGADSRGGARRRAVKAPEVRRDELVAAAVGLFQQRGFHQTTVQDIARAADVAPGTVYLYFASKDQVLLQCHHRLRHGMAAQIAASVADVLDRLEAGRDGIGPMDGLAELVEQMVEAAVAYARENRELCEVCMKYVPPADPGRGDQLGLLQPFADVLDRAANLGLVQVDDPMVTAHLLGAALGSSLCSAVVYGSPPLDRVSVAAKQLVWRALGSPARTAPPASHG
jgi:AcrR family transcriptional regulator